MQGPILSPWSALRLASEHKEQPSIIFARAVASLAVSCLQLSLAVWLVQKLGQREAHPGASSAESQPEAAPERLLPQPPITPDRPRHYEPSKLPVFRSEFPTTLSEQQQHEVLLRLYTDICASWRQLTEVRFKLLALVPAVSVLLLVSLLKSDPLAGPSLGASAPGGPAFPLLAISVLGLLATLGLWIYDTRNSELYDVLIGRGRRIEAELGIATGQFRGRPKPSRWFIRHDWATRLVYVASLVGWLAQSLFRA